MLCGQKNITKQIPTQRELLQKPRLSPWRSFAMSIPILVGVSKVEIDFSCVHPSTAEEHFAAQNLRYRVYVEEMGFIPLRSLNHEEMVERDFYDMAGRSIAFFIHKKISSNIQPVAYLRLILGSKVDILPCFKHLDICEPKFPQHALSEISRLIIDKQFRGSKSRDIIRYLTWSMVCYCVLHGIEECYAAIEPTTFRLLSSIGLRPITVGAKGSYMGSVLPVVFRIRDVLNYDTMRRVWSNIPYETSLTK